MTKLTLVKATLKTGLLVLCVFTLWGCRLVNVPKPGEVQSLSIEDVQPKVPQPGENVVISYTLSNTAGPDEAGNVVGFVGLHGIPKPLRQADGKVAQSEPFILRRGTTKTGELLFQAPAFADTNYEVSLGFLKTVTTRFSELATNYLNAEAFWKESKPRMLDIENGPESVGILAPFDLFRVFWDDNGIALNPKWGEQMNHPGSFPNPFLCGDGYPWTRPCTTQVTWKDENNWNLCRFGDGPINGHANWAPATFEGAIFWAGHSCGACDDDYNFNLWPRDYSGLTATKLDEGLHCEFSSDETIDHFKTRWWNSFHDAVDDSDEKAGKMVFGKFAIVIGLLGLDCAHASCGSESHPVWAMAINVKEDPTDDVWAIFVRNCGNEGYCSDGAECIDVRSFTFRLPWRSGATSVELGHYEFLSRQENWWSWEPLPDEKSVLVTFTIGPYLGQDRLNGELHMRWIGENVSQTTTEGEGIPRGPPPFRRELEAAVPEDDSEEAETKIARLIANMTSDQKAIFDANLPEEDTSVDSKVPRLVDSLRVIRIGEPFSQRAIRVLDLARTRKDKQRFEALRKAFGGEIPN